VTTRGRYPLRTRLLHWLTAVLVLTTLLVGFVMVNSLGSYAALLIAHATLGIAILVIVLARIVNRFTHRTPALPGSVGAVERVVAVGSELSMYLLLVAQPLVGWAMLSAAGRPVVLFGGLRLPSIAPFGADGYFVLREVHSVLAYALVVIVATHVTAVLLHTLTLRDGMLRRMGFGPVARGSQ
jgi:cytochrome b561